MAQPLHRISKIELVSFRQIRALLDMFTMLLSPFLPLFFSPLTALPRRPSPPPPPRLFLNSAYDCFHSSDKLG